MSCSNVRIWGTVLYEVVRHIYVCGSGQRLRAGTRSKGLLGCKNRILQWKRGRSCRAQAHGAGPSSRNGIGCEQAQCSCPSVEGHMLAPVPSFVPLLPLFLSLKTVPWGLSVACPFRAPELTAASVWSVTACRGTESRLVWAQVPTCSPSVAVRAVGSSHPLWPRPGPV